MTVVINKKERTLERATYIPTSLVRPPGFEFPDHFIDLPGHRRSATLAGRRLRPNWTTAAVRQTIKGGINSI